LLYFSDYFYHQELRGTRSVIRIIGLRAGKRTN